MRSSARISEDELEAAEFSSTADNLEWIADTAAETEETLAQARIMLSQLGTSHALVLADVFGATPCNVAQKLVDGVHSKLITGVNLPMLLRTVSYRHESLDALVARALIGATQGVMQVAITAPQNQTRRNHDQEQHDHQQ